MRKKGPRSIDPIDRLRFFKEKVEKELQIQFKENCTKSPTDRELNAFSDMISTKCSSSVKCQPIKTSLCKKRSNLGLGLHIMKQRKFKILRSKILSRKSIVEKQQSFTKIGLLGEGGSSFVYLIEDKVTGKRMVLKQYKKNTRKALKQYLIGKSLSHKSIIEYYQHQDNKIFMEYVEQEKPRCPLIVLAYKLAHAIHYLHTNNVCHTDIKPKNIIITGIGLKLIDFGESMKGQLWRKGKTGTYGYMAPQMFQEGYWNGKEADIWSFGMVCKEWKLHQLSEFCLVEKQHRPTIIDVLSHPVFRGCAGFA